MDITDFPMRLYYSIGDVSDIVKVEPHVLRYWETEFRNISPVKGENGRRMYRKKDVETILLIKHLLYEKKFTIAGAKKYFSELRRKGADLFETADIPATVEKEEIPAEEPAEAPVVPAPVSTSAPAPEPAPQKTPIPSPACAPEVADRLEALRRKIRKYIAGLGA